MKSSIFSLLRLASNIFLISLFVFITVSGTIIWTFIIILSILIPAGSIRIKVKKQCISFFNIWSFLNSLLIRLNTRVIISGDYHSLTKQNHYILISNHQAFTDILVNCCLQPGISLFTYVMKKSLLWQYPVMSWYCYYYGFPFLDRKDRQKDIQTLKKSYGKLKSLGNSLVIYPEGTRFSQQKKQQSESPNKNLLKPKIGGLATSLRALQDYLDGLVNVTIVYSGKGPSLLSLLSGKISKVNIHVELIELDDSFFGDYSTPQFKKDFTEKINTLWHQKDDLIEQLKKQ